VITCVAVPIQPFVPVIVTVYVPGVDTLINEVVPKELVPLDHEYETPPVACKLIFVVIHDNTVVDGAVIAAFGALMFWVITCETVAVQPFEPVMVQV
jgi:hypothetical protein